MNVIKPKTQLLIVMGVSGTGKSMVASALARQLDYLQLDADDFHSMDAKIQMAKKRPLSDAQRQPWIAAILQHLDSISGEGKGVVLAYSGLKRAHRQLFRALPFDCHYFFLDGDYTTLSRRMSARENHFFSAALLGSQFDALELPKNDETDVSRIDVTHSAEVVIQQVLQRSLILVERKQR